MSDTPEKRRRGRPRLNSDPQGLLDAWIAGLSPTALHIVDVARGVLLEKGYDAVTLEAVALEANVDPSTVRRQFISKADLLHAVFDRMQAEPWEALVERVKDISAPQERLSAYISGLGALVEGGQSAVGISEVLARGLRDPVLRGKIAADYDIARDGTLELGELDAGDDDELAPAARPREPHRGHHRRPVAASGRRPRRCRPGSRLRDAGRHGAALAARRSWRLSRARRFRARRRPDAGPRAGCRRAPARGARLP